MHPRPLLKLACSSLDAVSMAFSMRLSSILQNNLLGTESKVIPLQFSQLQRPPFFDRLNVKPCPDQSLPGISSCFQIVWNRSVSTLVGIHISAFNSSAC